MSLQDGIRAVQRAFTDSPPARWPLYVRQAKQHLRTAIDGFDERKYGFASVVDLLRAAGKEGVVRIERDRQGAIRVFPGGNIAPKPAMPVDEPEMLDGDISAEHRATLSRISIRNLVSSCRCRWRISRLSMLNLCSSTSRRRLRQRAYGNARRRRRALHVRRKPREWRNHGHANPPE